MFNLKKKTKAKLLFDEVLYLGRLSVALDAMGYKTKLVPIEGYPLSMECKIPGYEHLPIDLVAMFLPMREAFGDPIRIFQVYISLHDQEIPAEKFEALKDLCNHFNTNTPVGCYGVQEEIACICYKQVVTIRDDKDFDTGV